MVRLSGTVLFLFFAVAAQAQTVSLSSLLDEMTNRDAITYFPEPAYTCVQASSYDRAAKSPSEHWFANGDASQFIREEENNGHKEWVLMDADGPGTVVRWWITSHHYKSVCRVYLDGNPKPAVEANIGDLVGGKFLVDTPLSEETARGRNLYLPIPYAKHCKITVDDMPVQKNLYYQINYRTYAEGTAVETFTADNFKSLKEKAEKTQMTLATAGDQFIPLLLESPSIQLTVPKGGNPRSVAGRVGVPNGAAVQQIVLKVNAEGDKLAKALRSVVLSIKFDDKETVWCPLGDFFGSGVGINPYKSWYSRAEKDGTLISLWRMPFKNSMDVSLLNYSDEEVRITLKSLYAGPYQWNDCSMYFHCDWHQERNIETIGGNGTKDWNYITVKGKGVFAGDVLSVLNRNPAWWGEGDEKIYFDGQTFPSHFGTGTEDYYGYAWCTPQFFQSPFHFQPRAEGPGNYGNTTNARVRLLDGIPFTTDFRFDMEVWHWAKTKIDYAVATYWYALGQAEKNDFQDREAQIAEVQSPVTYQTPMSLEIPGFKIEKVPTAGNVQNQDLKHFEVKGRKWDKSDQLWWTGAKPGAKLELILDIEKDGKYKLVGELTKAKDYSIVQFYLDGQKIGEPVDLYHSEVIPTGAVEIGSAELKAGKHAVTIEITGKNEKADPGFMVGIDKLSLSE
ncbi:MAG: DUF2961 domain-containing protein [Planctomycetaceae bacterium]|nr:DUF2961 domain-containing protein [Planctomycetaceae bacterium]